MLDAKSEISATVRPTSQYIQASATCKLEFGKSQTIRSVHGQVKSFNTYLGCGNGVATPLRKASIVINATDSNKLKRYYSVPTPLFAVGCTFLLIVGCAGKFFRFAPRPPPGAGHESSHRVPITPSLANDPCFIRLLSKVALKHSSQSR